MSAEQRLVNELAGCYADVHGLVAVRDNHDVTVDMIAEDCHVYVVSARRKFPDRETQVQEEIPACGKCPGRHYPWRPCSAGIVW